MSISTLNITVTIFFLLSESYNLYDALFSIFSFLMLSQHEFDDVYCHIFWEKEFGIASWGICYPCYLKIRLCSVCQTFSGMVDKMSDVEKLYARHVDIESDISF